MIGKSTLKYVTVTLIVSGLTIFLHSGYFYVRGMLAQMLLNQAWEKSKITREFFRAWSGAGTYPVGKLRIESIDLSRVVLEAASKESLTYGPAHISASALPGEHGNIAIAGHRDSFFRNLKDLKRGEVIELESMSSVQYFLVTDIQITDAGSAHWIENTADDVITLITCYPFDYIGKAPMRYIIRGKLVREETANEVFSKLLISRG